MPIGPGQPPAEIAPIAPLGTGLGAEADEAYSPQNDFDNELIASVDDFLNTFGETIVYYPNGDVSRQILAIVDRKPPEKLDDAPYGAAPLMTITVANNQTAGISSKQVDTGLDKVELAVRIGQAVQQRMLTGIISQDAGMLTLEVR